MLLSRGREGEGREAKANEGGRIEGKRRYRMFRMGQ